MLKRLIFLAIALFVNIAIYKKVAILRDAEVYVYDRTTYTLFVIAMIILFSLIFEFLCYIGVIKNGK